MMTMITWWCLPIGILRDVWNVDRIVCNPPKSTSFGHPEKLCKADVRKLFGWLEDYVDLPNQRSRTAFELEIYFISFIFFLVCCFCIFLLILATVARICLSGQFWKDLGRPFVRPWNGFAWAFGDVFETGVLGALVLLVSWFYKGRVFQPWMLVKTFRAKTSVPSVVPNYCYDRSGRSMVE